MYKYLVMAFLGTILVAPVSAKLGDDKLKEEIKQIREEKREMAKDIRASKSAEINNLREEYKQKLAKIKDERKKSLLEKFNQQVSELNTRRTSEMKKSLEKMTKVLNDRIAKGATDGVDAAKAALEAAKLAVEDQAAKVYVVSITDETKLKGDAGKIKAQLESDLKTVQEKMKVAKQAVYEVVMKGLNK